MALGASGIHSTLAHTGAGTINFQSNQAFYFVDLGAQQTTYGNIITGLSSDPGTEGGWTIQDPGWAGSFSYSGGNISLTLTAVPEPSTWISAALAFGAIGFASRRRFIRLLSR